MQAYGSGFARVYSRLWGDYSKRIGPRILEFYAGTAAGQARAPVLDLCCGAGHLALLFLEAGFPVTGIDLSEHMLEHATKRAKRHVKAGAASFKQADVSRFTVDGEFGLAVSTFDSLNHLSSLQALQSCFTSVSAAVRKRGLFIFDLNTRRGLMHWNNMSVQENDDSVLITRGIFDQSSERAHTRISGFLENADGLYERFEETVYNTAFECELVKESLLGTGWKKVLITAPVDLTTAAEDPEGEPRVFFIARK